MSVDTSSADGGVTGAAAGADIRWLGGRLLTATGGIVGGLTTPSIAGGKDFAVTMLRAAPETTTAAEPEIDYEGLPQDVATSTHMLAGAVAGIMEHCVMYPIDCVKVKTVDRKHICL